MERSSILQAFTRREFFGKPADLILGAVALFASPLFMLYALDKYQTLDPNPPLLFILPGAVVAVAWLLSITRRKSLMPWGEKAPTLMWAGTLAISVLPGMVAVGAVLVVNGAFDQSAPAEIRSSIIQSCDRSNTIKLEVTRQASRTPVPLKISSQECLTVDAGDSVRLSVRSGALGIAWVETHSFVMPR